jgi:flagella basal body P-ring formation protein FlgA
MILACIIWLMSAVTVSIDPGVKTQIESLVASHTTAVHEIEYRSVPRELEQLDARASVRIIDEPRAIYRGMINLPVEVSMTGARRMTYYVGLRVRTFESVAVAVKMIERHQTLDPSQLVMQQIETTQFNGEPVTASASALAGMRSRQIIGKGKPLATMMIEPLPLVASGSEVTVRVVKENVRLSVSGKAREDGWMGSVVSVDIGSLKRQVRARVVDRMNVEIVE